MSIAPFVVASRLAYREGRASSGERALPEEAAVALVHDATSSAVMMATPADLEDFGIGFSLTEGIIGTLDELRDLEVVANASGIEVRMWLRPERSADHAVRRRRLAGPTGCGLCGLESLADAVRPVREVRPSGYISPGQILETVAALIDLQPLGSATRAAHAAAFWTLDEGLVMAREDVGRHNALDKLAGALARAGRSAREAAIVLTSRVSVEMVQKTAAIGAPIIVAVSAPTALAVRLAQSAGITLVGVARSDGFEVFANPQRIRDRRARHPRTLATQ
jgi:FdhD protein